MARIAIDPAIKDAIATRVVQEAHQAYDVAAQGRWYVVDGAAVVHAESNAAWTPWDSDAEVIGVTELVWRFGGARQDNAEFGVDDDAEDGEMDEAVLFCLAYVPDSYEAAA